jgi:mono/diheme cytochrome c family protein
MAPFRRDTGRSLARALTLLALAPLALLALACRARDEGPPLDPAAVRRGAAVYRAHCASCHGARGEATPDWKRPDARGDLPPPPHDSTGHTWHHADGLLYRIVATGVTDPTARRPSRMPAFGTALSPDEIRAVLTYLKTLWTPEQRRRQREASREDPLPR